MASDRYAQQSRRSSPSSSGRSASIAPRTVYIAGPGHSGSTLLTLLLGGHPRISALGEVHRLYLSARMTSRPHACGCGEDIVSCPFWAAASDELRALAGVSTETVLLEWVTTDPAFLEMLRDDDEVWPHDHVPPQLLNPTMHRLLMILGSVTLWRALSHVLGDVATQRRALENSVVLYEAVRRAANTPFIVDSTKNPARGKGLYLIERQRFRLVYLVRDGRAVCYSRMRREGTSMAQAARVWRAEHLKQRAAQATIPRRFVRRLRYEDLCRDPQGELEALCEWLGLPFETDMFDGKKPRHALGGNPMRFRSSPLRVVADEAWKDALSDEDLQDFEKQAGRLNRRFGYH